MTRAIGITPVSLHLRAREAEGQIQSCDGNERAISLSLSLSPSSRYIYKCGAGRR